MGMGYLVIVMGIVGLLALSSSGRAQERLYRGDPDSPLARSEKINPNLRILAQELGLRSSTGGNARALGASNLSQGILPVDESGSIQAYIHLSSIDAPNLEQLRRQGVRIEISNPRLGIVQGWIPYRQMDAVADLPFVSRITMPSFGVSNLAPCVSDPNKTCRTEGDSVHHSDALRALGLDGRGIKVGVISDGIDGLCDAAAAQELPSNVEAMGTCNDANPCLCLDGDEGTAMLEIVHDMAPGATLGFGAGLSSSLAFIDRVERLTKEFQADVIVDDIGFFLEPYFEDGPIAQAVREAVDQGVIYVTAAGNSGDSHYEGEYVDSGDGLGSHEISEGNDSFEVYGFNFLVTLQWTNPFGQASDDYDLCLASETAEECSLHNTRQDGNDDPLEMLPLFFCLEGCHLQVRRISGQAQRLELFVLRGDLDVADRVPAGSIFGHAAVPGVLATAAVYALDPGNDSLEIYSSQGPSRIEFPTLEIRDKPDITASDGVEVSGFGGFPTPFFGTSAAAPHVAAVAAQLLGGSGLAPEILPALKGGAVDLGETGFDELFGFGRLDASASASLFADHPPNSNIDSPAGDLRILPGDSVDFVGSCMSFAGPQGMKFQWTFGEGSGIADTALEQPGELVFDRLGEFTVTLSCSDGSGRVDPSPAHRTIRVQAPAEPTEAPSPAPSPQASATPPPPSPPDSASSGGCSLMMGQAK